MIMTTQPYLPLKNPVLLAQLDHDAIRIEVKKSDGAVNPFETSAFKMVSLDEFLKETCQSDPNRNTANSLKAHKYFSACGLEPSDYEWSVIKKNVQGKKVAIGKNALAEQTTTEGFIYIAKDDLLTAEQKPDAPYVDLKGKAFLKMMDDVEEVFDGRIESILDQHRAWELNRVYDITLTYKFNPKISMTVHEVSDLEGTQDIEDAVKKLHKNLIKKIAKEACTLKITVDIDRDDFGDDENETDFYKYPMKYLEKGFLDDYAIDFVFIEDRSPVALGVANSKKLFIGSHNYSIARKELTFSVDPNRVPYFQDIYDATSKPLLSNMEAFLEDYGNTGWIVMRDLMAKRPLQDWDKLVVSAFWTALMEGIGCVSYKKSDFQK